MGQKLKERKETHRNGVETNVQSKYDDMTVKDVVHIVFTNVMRKFKISVPDPWELMIKLKIDKKGNIKKQKITWGEFWDSLKARDCLKYVPEYEEEEYAKNGFDPDGPMIYLFNRETKEIVPLFCGEVKSQVATANALERVDNNAGHFRWLCYGLPIYPYLVFFHGEAFKNMKAGIWKGVKLGGGKKDAINSRNIGMYGENLCQATKYVTGEPELDADFVQDKIEEMLLDSIDYYSKNPYKGTYLIQIEKTVDE